MNRLVLILFCGALMIGCSSESPEARKTKFIEICTANFVRSMGTANTSAQDKTEALSDCACLFTEFDKNLESDELDEVTEILASTEQDSPSDLLVKQFGEERADAINEIANTCFS